MGKYQFLESTDHSSVPQLNDGHVKGEFPLGKDGSWRRRTILNGIVTGALGVVVNIALLAWATTKENDGDGTADVFAGSCSEVNMLFTSVHLVINIWATIIVALSAACLWALPRGTGPAQAGRSRFDSWRPWLRGIFVLTLLFSPLLWNAILLPAPLVSDFMGVHVTPSFLAGAPYQEDPVAVNDGLFLSRYVNMAAVARLRDTHQHLVRLDVRTCSALASAAPYVSEWSNFLIVSDLEASNDTIVKIHNHQFKFPLQGFSDSAPSETRNLSGATHWMMDVPFCNGSRVTHGSWYEDYDQFSCRDSDSTKKAAVQYCLGEPIHDTCSLKMSLTMLVVLLVVQLIMLAHPVALQFTQLLQTHPRPDGDNTRTTVWIGIFMFATVPPALLFTVRSIGENNLAAAWNNIGFGQVDPVYLATALPGIVDRDKSLSSTIIVANLPQLLVSILYLGYSRLLASIPPASDNSRSFMPLLLTMPIITAFACLRWFVSQSLFPVLFKWYNSNGTRYSKFDVINIGYSLRAIVATFVLYSVLALVPSLVGILLHRQRKDNGQELDNLPVGDDLEDRARPHAL